MDEQKLKIAFAKIKEEMNSIQSSVNNEVATITQSQNKFSEEISALKKELVKIEAAFSKVEPTSKLEETLTKKINDLLAKKEKDEKDVPKSSKKTTGQESVTLREVQLLVEERVNHEMNNLRLEFAVEVQKLHQRLMSVEPALAKEEVKVTKKNSKKVASEKLY